MTQTLKYLIQTADGLAGQFGADCEAAVCDLIEYAPEKSIVYIVNGHVTNRKPGETGKLSSQGQAGTAEQHA